MPEQSRRAPRGERLGVPGGDGAGGGDRDGRGRAVPGGAERRGCGRQLLRSPALIAGVRAPNSESAPGLVGTAHRLGGEVVAAAPALRGRPRPYPHPRPRARRQRCRPALFPGPSGGSSRRLLFNTLPRERALPAPQILRHLAAKSGTGTSATQKNPNAGRQRPPRPPIAPSRRSQPSLQAMPGGGASAGGAPGAGSAAHPAAARPHGAPFPPFPFLSSPFPPLAPVHGPPVQGHGAPPAPPGSREQSLGRVWGDFGGGFSAKGAPRKLPRAKSPQATRAAPLCAAAHRHVGLHAWCFYPLGNQQHLGVGLSRLLDPLWL